MKDGFNRVFPVVLIHLAAGFICALVIAFRQDVAALVLPPFGTAFKMRDAVIRFAQFYPALIVAGLLTGYSDTFGKLILEASITSKKQKKASDPFKSAFIFCIVLAAVYAILVEGVVPILKSRQTEAIAKTDSYNNYMLLCSRERDAGNFRAAYANAEAALAIWRDSVEAQKASDDAHIIASELRDGEFGFMEEEELIARGLRGYSSHDLLEKAREAAERADFYNAHYFATLSCRVAAEDAPERDDALRLASESWNRIRAAADEMLAEPERSYYVRKLRGYSDIQSGDFLSAYYYFLSIKEENEMSGGGLDPDIDIFLEMARQGVLSSFFFIDEIEGFALFEQEGGIFFTVPNDAGGKDAVLIGGVFRCDTGAADGAYFRDFEMARFNSRNERIFQVSAPYAKMLPFTDGDGATRPQIVLTAIDRSTGGETIEPRVVAGAFPPQDALSASLLALDMPYKDMALLLDASAGVDSMSPGQLFAFSRCAPRYGLQGAVYLAELIQRIAEPFIAFIMAVLAIIWAFKLQIKENRPFSAWWIIPMPFIAIACGYAVSAARQGINVCTMLFAAKAPSLAIPLSACLVIVLLVAVTAWFFAQRNSDIRV